MKLLAAENLQQSIQDRILMLLQAGHQQEEVFKDIFVQCRQSLTSRASKQELANHIAIIDRMDVFAIGSIPKGLRELEQ